MVTSYIRFDFCFHQKTFVMIPQVKMFALLATKALVVCANLSPEFKVV